MGTAGALFQRDQVLGIVAAASAVEGLAADSEMAAGAGHVATPTIKIHPIQADSRLSTQLFPRARQLARTGNFSIMNLHFDTLSECH
jgi:hypothetical protein